MGKVGEFDPSVVPYFLKLNQSHYWVDYDEETDTLYLSFRKPQCADDSIMKGDFVYHYAENKLVGVTVLHARNKNGGG
jgi:uncharacterized protein YuzE